MKSRTSTLGTVTLAALLAACSATPIPGNARRTCRRFIGRSPAPPPRPNEQPGQTGGVWSELRGEVMQDVSRLTQRVRQVANEWESRLWIVTD